MWWGGVGMIIRRARDEDSEQIVRIFHETIHKVNVRDYTREQVDAWSPRMPNREEWTVRRLHTRATFVADEGGIIAGFGELERDGHVDCFYCHHEWQRQGVGSAILARIEREAAQLGLGRLFTEASITAKPFFEARGFRVVARQTAVRRGVALVNFRMEKELASEGRVGCERGGRCRGCTRSEE
jgi:N-acetylglutamate synthase-like GNAT family acetyltransferase